MEVVYERLRADLRMVIDIKEEWLDYVSLVSVNIGF